MCPNVTSPKLFGFMVNSNQVTVIQYGKAAQKTCHDSVSLIIPLDVLVFFPSALDEFSYVLFNPSLGV